MCWLTPRAIRRSSWPLKIGTAPEKTDPSEDFRISLGGLLGSFEDFSFEHYVYISSIDIYPDHSHPGNNHEDAPIKTGEISNYGFHKCLGEQMVRHYVSSWLIIRLGGVLGPGLKKNPVYDLLHDIPLRVNLDSRYQYTSTDFLARAVYDLAHRGLWGEVVNLCGTGTISLREISRALSKEPESQEKETPVEIYEVNNGKLSGLMEVPSTSRTVEEFLSSVAVNDDETDMEEK